MIYGQNMDMSLWVSIRGNTLSVDVNYFDPHSTHIGLCPDCSDNSYNSWNICYGWIDHLHHTLMAFHAPDMIPFLPGKIVANSWVECCGHSQPANLRCSIAQIAHWCLLRSLLLALWSFTVVQSKCKLFISEHHSHHLLRVNGRSMHRQCNMTQN